MSIDVPGQGPQETGQSRQFLNEEYTINTPENVTFGYDVAGIGSRFIAALVDSVILVMVLFLLNILAMMILSALGPEGADPFDAVGADEEPMWFVGLLIALYALLNFIVLWGYYIFFELAWRGQTPGKRAANIRVVRMDGNAIGFLESVIRNLVRIIDFIPFGYGIGMIAMFCNRQSRRLGDFAAGTLVIHVQKAQTLDDFLANSPGIDNAPGQVPAREQSSLGQQRALSAETLPGSSVATAIPSVAGLSAAMSAPNAATDPLRERFPNIQQLSSIDFELITDALSRHQTTPIPSTTLTRMAKLMATKLDVGVPMTNSRQFLSDVAEAYRRYHR